MAAKKFCRIVVEKFRLVCPHCDAEVARGSEAAWPEEVKLPCPDCGRTVTLPHDQINALWSEWGA